MNIKQTAMKGIFFFLNVIRMKAGWQAVALVVQHYLEYNLIHVKYDGSPAQ